MKLLGRELFRPGHAVSTTRVMPAPAEVIFDVLTDPAMHPVIDGSETVKGLAGRPVERLEMGSTFGMDMDRVASYRVLNEVVEFEENRLIAWRHFHGHRWRYELEPVEGGTEVTETFDYSGARTRIGLEVLGFPERNLEGMVKTLERLEQVTTSAADDGGQPQGGDE